MAAKEERILQAVFKAIDTVNQARPPAQRLRKAADAALLGSDSPLDSLGLVNLVVAVEEEIAEEFGVTVNLADERMRSMANSPLRTVQSLVGYLSSVVRS